MAHTRIQDEFLCLDHKRFTISEDELNKICTFDRFNLRTKNPWIRSSQNLIGYLISIINIQNIYEFYLDNQRIQTYKMFIYPRNLFYLNPDDDEDVHIMYMNTGLLSENGEHFYMVLNEKEIEGLMDKEVQISFCFRRKSLNHIKDLNSLDCNVILFSLLRIMNSVNIENIQSGHDFSKVLDYGAFFDHVFELESKYRWDRLGYKYKKRNGYDYNELEIEDIRQELQKKLEKDIDYSLQEFYKKPWLAIPTGLSTSMVRINEKPYISQFAIPLYYLDEANLIPHAALIFACKFPDGDSRYNKALRRNPLLYFQSQAVDDISYYFAKYELNTVLTLEMLYKDSLFSLNGLNNAGEHQLWLRTFCSGRDLPHTRWFNGKVGFQSYKDNNGKDAIDFFIKADNWDQLFYINRDEKANDQMPLNPGDRVRFQVDITGNEVYKIEPL